MFPATPPDDITRLLAAWRAGDATAFERLVTLLHPALHSLALRKLSGERRDHTLGATALVNEAYLRLVDADLDWQSRAHFLAIAARVMRRVLVDHARARSAEKRGGGAPHLSLLETREIAIEGSFPDLLDLHAAMEALAEQDGRKARVVELHYFGGLTHPEIAEVEGVSEATVDRDLRFSRAWLRERLAG